jgi:hypothetical protein
MRSAGLGTLLLGAQPGSMAGGNKAVRPVPSTWARGVEGQRKADLGDGTFLNPILAGDHPDPSILRDGDDYYMTFSTFDAYPGLVIWHSKDLVNWQPLTAALTKNIGSVWAPELCKHKGRFYLYIPNVVGNLGGRHPRPLVRSDRPQPAASYRPGTCGGRRWLALAIPFRRGPCAPVG